MKKKLSLLVFVLALSVVLSGCGQKDHIMDQPADDGNYHYSSDLGYSMVFPSEFIYYQFQRTTTDNYVDVEFFVPTNDVSYPQKVPSYANPVTVRIYEKSYWKQLDEESRSQFIEMKDSWSKVYTLKFWETVPSDWQDRWNDDMKDFIIENFE